MDLTFLFFLSSGLFLGWSLGANDASNIFGTAVGTKMLKFRTAAVIGSVFVVLGAVYGGAGGSATLNRLGHVNALAGAFMVALAAALSVYWMARLRITVSTSQAIVGAIVGWNLYGGLATDMSVFGQIVSTWVICPVLSGVVAVVLYFLMRKLFRVWHVHLLRQDAYIRRALIVTGALCAYALGANNIANVVGVFADSAPFEPVHFGKLFEWSGQQVLFFLGAVAICVGIFTYSHKVIMTVGNNLMKMSPRAALVVVLAQALVLLVFSSQSLNTWLVAHQLPQIPLVPVSSTQSVIGAILGIGLLKGGRGINWNIGGQIVLGWIITPLAALVLCFVGLFFMENVFRQTVFVF